MNMPRITRSHTAAWTVLPSGRSLKYVGSTCLLAVTQYGNAYQALIQYPSCTVEIGFYRSRRQAKRAATLRAALA